jgi:phosphoserine phosphatase
MTNLVCLDMDGVLFVTKNFWLDLHKAYGTYDAGLEATRKYLHTDYQKLVKEVVGTLWRGKDARVYETLVRQQEYMRGIELLFSHCKKEGFKTAIISSGSIDCARRVQRDFGVDYIYANELVIRHDKITGEFNWPLGAGGMKKVEIIKSLCLQLRISPKETFYIGDSETDIEAFGLVGTPIAFNAENDKVKKAARFVVEKRDLKEVIPLIVVRDEF